MTSYTVTATITTEITDAAALSAIGGSSGDDTAKVQSAVDAGLQELRGIASRYGFTITDASAVVEPS
jgi:hypothetical protein